MTRQNRDAGVTGAARRVCRSALRLPARLPRWAAAEAAIPATEMLVHCEKGLPDMTQDIAKPRPSPFRAAGRPALRCRHFPGHAAERAACRKGVPRFREQFALVFSLPHEVPISWSCFRWLTRRSAGVTFSSPRSSTETRAPRWKSASPDERQGFFVAQIRRPA